MHKLLLATLMAALATPALAADGRWTRAEAEGDLEFFIDQDTMRLFVACPTKKGQADLPSAVTLHYNDMSEVEKFTVSIGATSVDGPVSAEGADGAGRFRTLLGALRQGDATVRFGETTLRLPRGNAAEVLPAPDALPCNLQP
jgi:hypothetical protein